MQMLIADEVEIEDGIVTSISGEKFECVEVNDVFAGETLECIHCISGMPHTRCYSE